MQFRTFFFIKKKAPYIRLIIKFHSSIVDIGIVEEKSYTNTCIHCTVNVIFQIFKRHSMNLEKYFQKKIF